VGEQLSVMLQPFCVTAQLVSWQLPESDQLPE